MKANVDVSCSISSSFTNISQFVSFFRQFRVDFCKFCQRLHDILTPSLYDILTLWCGNFLSLVWKFFHSGVDIFHLYSSLEIFRSCCRKGKKRKISTLETKYFHIRDVHVGPGWDGSQGRASPALFNCFLRIRQERNISIPDLKNFRTREKTRMNYFLTGVENFHCEDDFHTRKEITGVKHFHTYLVTFLF